MIGEGQAIVYYLTNHYEKEIAKNLFPFWYHYYSYITDHYADVRSYVVNSHDWIEQVTQLSKNCRDRLFFYTKLPVLHADQQHKFLSTIQQRMQDPIALGVCLPHTLGNSEQVLGLWENTNGENMRLHVRKQEIPFGFVLADNELFFERPSQADDSRKHIYHVPHVKEETISYLLKNPHLKMSKMIQSYFLL